MEEKFAFLGVSLKFPVEIDQFGKPIYVRGVDVIRQSITEILDANILSRFMLPEFGSDINKLIFEQNTKVLRALMGNYVRQALEIWEPRIRIDSVDVTSSSIEKIDVVVKYFILQANEADTFVYPYYRNLKN